MKSKFFRVALEGATTDGRVIERSTIEQMARTYNRAKYGARIFLEHIRGILPDGPFKAYGDVLALKAEEVEIDGKKLLGLFAQIEPTPDLVAMTKAKQKIFTSVEVATRFAGGDDAYMVGLGVTDSPASLGTEVLAFAAQHPDANPFTARKQSSANLFTAAAEANIEFEDETGADAGASLLDRITAMFVRKDASADQRFADAAMAVEAIARHTVEEHAATAATFTELQTQITKLQGELATAIAKINAVSEKIDNTADPSHRQRQASPGGNGAAVTDC